MHMGPLSPVHDRAWRAFLQAHARLTERLDAELQQATPLALGEFEVLDTLWRSDGRLRMAELAEKVRASRSGLTRRIDRLERRGLVRRETCWEDKRGLFAALTDQGRAALGRSLPLHAAGLQRLFFDFLTEEQIRLLAERLEEVAAAASNGEPPQQD